MKVLQVSDGYPPATGGLERTVQALAKELADRGHDVTVATLSYPGAPAEQVEGRVRVLRLDGLTRFLQRFSSDPGHHFHPTVPDPQLISRLQEIVDEFRPDIVHVHGWILHSCLKVRLPQGAALVHTLHDYSLTCAKKTLIHRDDLDTCCSGPSIPKCLSCSRSSYGVVKGTALTLGIAESRRRLDRVSMYLPISDAVAAASLAGVDTKRIAIVPSFVPDGVAGEAVGVPRPEFLPDGDFVLFVGALGEHKGLGMLATAHQHLHAEVPLVVIGSQRGDTPSMGSTRERPVIVRTNVPHEQIMAAFAAAAVAVVPSRWPEPLGLVAVEAMAAGTPVVASEMGALSEVVHDEETGIVVPAGDAHALADAMDRLLADPALRARMGAAGIVRAQAYTASAVLPMVLAAYERALDMTGAELTRMG